MVLFEVLRQNIGDRSFIVQVFTFNLRLDKSLRQAYFVEFPWMLILIDVDLNSLWSTTLARRWYGQNFIKRISA